MAEEKTVVTAVTKPMVKKTAILKEELMPEESETMKKETKKAPKNTKKKTEDIKKEEKDTKKASQDTTKEPKITLKKPKDTLMEAKNTSKPKKVKSVTVQEELHIQIQGKSYTKEDFVKIAKDVWVYDMKQDLSDIKSIALYVKPEEMKVYFVVNDNETGSFSI